MGREYGFTNLMIYTFLGLSGIAGFEGQAICCQSRFEVDSEFETNFGEEYK